MKKVTVLLALLVGLSTGAGYAQQPAPKPGTEQGKPVPPKKKKVRKKVRKHKKRRPLVNNNAPKPQP
ncbi:MAG: hypothetical protein QM642_09485 [Edaphocola sp.]